MTQAICLNRAALEGSLLNQLSVVSKGQVIPIFFGSNQVFVLDVMSDSDSSIEPLGLANDTELVIEEPEDSAGKDNETALDSPPTPQFKQFMARSLKTCPNPFMEANCIFLQNEAEFDFLSVESEVDGETRPSTWKHKIALLELIDWKTARPIEVIVERNNMVANSSILLNTNNVNSDLLLMNVELNKANRRRMIKILNSKLKADEKRDGSRECPSISPIMVKDIITGLSMDQVSRDLLFRVKMFMHEAVIFGVNNLCLASSDPWIQIGNCAISFRPDALLETSFEEFANMTVYHLISLIRHSCFEAVDLNYMPRELITPVSLTNASPIIVDPETNNKIVKLRSIDSLDLQSVMGCLQNYLYQELGFDLLVLDLNKFIVRDPWSVKTSSLGELFDEAESDIIRRTIAGKICILLVGLDKLFREDIPKQEKKTYVYITARIQR